MGAIDRIFRRMLPTKLNKLRGAALSLDFTNGNPLDSRITFSRASSATRVNKSGLIETVATNAPRFDYDPITLQPKGLLIEEQRTNLLLQSGFAGAATGTPGTAPTNWTIANTGGTIDSVVVDSIGQNIVGVSASANRQVFSQTVTLSANTSYYCSCFVVSNSGLAINQLIGVFTLPTGATSSYLINGNTVANPNVAIPVAGDRIAVLVAVSTTAGTGLFRIGVGVSGNSTGSHVFKWPQVEAGSFATSYIPTTTAQATRAADVATMTGANFSSWYNQSEGTLFAEAASVSARPVITIDDGTMNNRYQLTLGSGYSPGFAVVSGGVVSADLYAAAATQNTYVREAGAYRPNDFALSANGGSVTTDTSGALPVSVNTLRLGVYQNGFPLNGWIKRLAYFPRRLSNAELQGITS